MLDNNRLPDPAQHRESGPKSATSKFHGTLRPNPSKVEAILKMESPRTLRDSMEL